MKLGRLPGFFLELEMKHQKDNEKAPLADQSDEMIEVFSDLLTAIADDEKEHFAQDTEAFDRYVQKVRSKLHVDLALFQNRFAKGYQALLDELKNEQNMREPPKPNDRRI